MQHWVKTALARLARMGKEFLVSLLFPRSSSSSLSAASRGTTRILSRATPAFSNVHTQQELRSAVSLRTFDTRVPHTRIPERRQQTKVNFSSLTSFTKIKTFLPKRRGKRIDENFSR
ncbi:hypothetical protein CDAR_106271 [Caerostris darwini]|uniref:Uncharacterized protein n=1 Tax=Caerostris darwini TaxID=1538125 RepID=A0AAV4SHV5_9ARAC|nr:hypothetical protein CDAR_106271 [Caerostris darwini]